jgi:hypothetical protein
MLYLLDPPAAEAQHVNILRQNLEIWIVPTYNPEGLNVVHNGLDVSYRKNKHDFSPTGPTPNGVFDYDPAIGNDIDGVDLNRNYDFNWVLGDTFMEPDPSDYAAHYDITKELHHGQNQKYPPFVIWPWRMISFFPLPGIVPDPAVFRKRYIHPGNGKILNILLTHMK